jgi:hypothetical protein
VFWLLLLLLLLLTAVELSLGGFNASTTTDKTNNIHKRNSTKDTVQTIQNTVNTSTHITKTSTQLHITKLFKTTTMNILVVYIIYEIS